MLRTTSAWLLAALCACSAAPTTTVEAEAPARPHIVVVLADDLGYVDLGFTGCTDFATPNLDRLAYEGVVCTDGHVSASVCAPSRAGLLTGRYQQRTGFECNLGSGDGLLAGTETFAQRLRDAGYETALVGKWHVGAEAHNHPTALGFEHFTGLLSGSRSYFPLTEKAPGRTKRIERDGVPVPESEFTYLTDFLTDEGVRLIEQRDTERPLLLFMSYTAPHGPMHARADLLDRYDDSLPAKRAKYAAMVASLDEGVGRLRDALERNGMSNDTLTVFLSDNGGATNNASDNGPWRGMKGSKWEGGHRVPFVVHWPAVLESTVCAAPVSSLDLGPTFVAAARARALDPCDGHDLVPRFRREATHDMRRRMYWRRAVAAAARHGRWKLIRIDESDGTRRAPVLVDLWTDPGETKNVATEYPEHVDELTRALEAWESELVPPRWLTAEVWRENQRKKHEFGLVGREAERRLP